MTAHTETTSKVTETINSIDYNTGWQYSVTGTNVGTMGTGTEPKQCGEFSESKSTWRNRGANLKYSILSKLRNCTIYNYKSWRSISVHPNLSGSRDFKSDYNSKGNRSYKRNRYYKYILPVIGCLSFSSNAFADVGGVSATANPIANSSGSVTNQAYSGFTRSICN